MGYEGEEGSQSRPLWFMSEQTRGVRSGKVGGPAQRGTVSHPRASLQFKQPEKRQEFKCQRVRAENNPKTPGRSWAKGPG